MSGLAGNPTIGTVDLYTSNSSQGNTALGQLIFGDAGKAFRYVKAGETLVVGNLVQGPAIDTQFDDLAVASNAAIGVTSLSLTNGTTVLTGDEFKDGTLEVSVTPGLGQEFTIMGNSAATSGGALTVYLDRPLRVALTSAASKVTLRKSVWNGVIQAPATTLTGTIAGVAIFPIASGEYGWVQTKGVGAVLSDATSITATNQAVCGGSGTAGCITLQVAGLPYVGRALRAAATGKTIPVLLELD